MRYPAAAPVAGWCKSKRRTPARDNIVCRI